MRKKYFVTSVSFLICLIFMGCVAFALFGCASHTTESLTNPVNAPSSTNKTVVIPATGTDGYVFAGHIKLNIDPKFGIVAPNQSSVQLRINSESLNSIDNKVYLDADGDYIVTSMGTYKEPFKIDVTVSEMQIKTSTQTLKIPMRPLQHSYTEQKNTGLRATIKEEGRDERYLFFLPFVSITVNENGQYNVRDFEPTSVDQVRLGIKMDKLLWGD